MLFYVLYSNKTWVVDQSEHVQGPIYIVKAFIIWFVFVDNIMCALVG